MTDQRDNPTDPTPPPVPDAWDPSGGTWVQQWRAAEEHATTCTDWPCERCNRFVCRCGVKLEHERECMRCVADRLRAAALKPTRVSIPARFQWAVDVAPSLLARRVRSPRVLVDRGLSSPPSKWLLFSGPTGAGKTSLAVAMLDAWVRQAPVERTGALFVEAAWLSRARARHKLGQGESDLVELCLSAPLLLLDDLGQEREDRDGCITDVIYGRSNRERPTWVTCGLASGDVDAFAAHLSQRYDGGFVRRILDGGSRVELGKVDGIFKTGTE